MKAFIVAVLFSAVAALGWYTFLSGQQKPAEQAFGAPPAVRL
jgi:hypothetical protein